MESALEAARARARSLSRNWEATSLRVINSVESIAVAAALGKMEKEDILQGEMFGLKVEHAVMIGGAVIAVASDDETLVSHATAFATGAAAVAAYKRMAE